MTDAALAAKPVTRTRRCLRIQLRGPDWRHFAIKPILLIGQRGPSSCHPHVASVRRLTFGTLGELKTIIGALTQQV